MVKVISKSWEIIRNKEIVRIIIWIVWWWSEVRGSPGRVVRSVVIIYKLKSTDWSDTDTQLSNSPTPPEPSFVSTTKSWPISYWEAIIRWWVKISGDICYPGLLVMWRTVGISVINNTGPITSHLVLLSLQSHSSIRITWPFIQPIHWNIPGPEMD